MSMIEFVRRRKKGIVNFILLGLAVILMISFGLDSFMIKSRQENYAIKVDGQEITQSQYQNKLRSMEQLYSAQLKGMFEQIKASLNLPQKIADQMIEEKLLSKFINQLGLSASHSQIEERIAQLPYFGGKVDQQSYIGYLQATGMSENAMIDAVTKEVVEGELNRTFSQLAPLSEDELKEIFHREQQQAKFIAAKFTPPSQTSEIPASDIEKYYNEHKQEFSVPKQVKLEYILLSPTKYLDKVPVADVDLQQLYIEKSSLFMEPEKVLLSKISFTKEVEPAKDVIPTESPNDKKQKLAQSVIERVKKGEDFGQLARELSEDKETKEKSGELGWKNSTELTQDLRDALVDVAVGTTSGIVEDDKEFAVYFVSQKQAERQKPFESVKEELIKEIKAQDAPMYLEVEADKLYAQLQPSNESLEAFAKREALDYKIENSVSRTAPTVAKALREDAIDSEPGTLRMLSSENGIYFYKVIESIPEHPKTLEEAKSDIVSNLRINQAKAVSKTKAEDFLKAQANEKSTENFKKSLAQSGAVVVETSLDSMDAQKTEFISSSDDVFALYSLTNDKPVYDKIIQSGDATYVVMLAEKKEPNAEDFSKKRAEILAQQAQKTGSRIIDTLVAALRAESKIEINPDIFNGA